MKKDDEVAGPSLPSADCKDESLLLKMRDQDVLIAELRAGLNEAIGRTRTTEEAARQAQDDLPLAYFSVDRQWRVLSANRAAAALWNTEERWLLNTNFWDLIGRGMLVHSRHLTESGNGRPVRSDHFSFVLKKWVRVHVLPSLDGFNVWVEDTTSQKIQLEAHTRLWQQQKALVDNSPDIILRFGLTGQCVFANQAVRRLLGLDPASLMRKKPQEMGISPDAAERLAGMSRQVFLTGEAVTEEFDIAADGAGKRFSWRAVPERALRVVDSVLFIGRDVTAEKEAEELKERLETQIRESQKLEAVGRLSGGIAHDFNNLLAVILGNAELALDDVREAAIRHNLRNLRTAALRGRELVKQILAFSRKSPRSRNVVPMVPHVKETVKLLRSTIPANIDIRIDAKAARDAVAGDVSQMQQVLVNLATNAGQAMPDGGTLTIALKDMSFTRKNLPEPGLRPGDYLALSVTDTGRGMDEEARKHLFEPFFTQKEAQGGTGLGLSVVYGIVKAHKGAITVKTEPGRGSTFTVFLPLTETEGARTEGERQAEVKGKGRILFVDDEELVTTVAHDALSRLGYDVTTSMEPEKALRIFAEDRTAYDMVITDQTMPEMTGMALARRLLDIRPDLPIVLCTGYASGVNEKSAKASGIKAFLMKPYTRAELSATVGEVLREEQHGPGREMRGSTG